MMATWSQCSVGFCAGIDLWWVTRVYDVFHFVCPPHAHDAMANAAQEATIIFLLESITFRALQNWLDFSAKSPECLWRNRWYGHLRFLNVPMRVYYVTTSIIIECRLRATSKRDLIIPRYYQSDGCSNAFLQPSSSVLFVVSFCVLDDGEIWFLCLSSYFILYLYSCTSTCPMPPCYSHVLLNGQCFAPITDVPI